MATISRFRNKWRAQIRRKGHPALSKTFLNKTDAQRWARDQEAQLDRIGSVPAELRITFGELLDLYTASLVRPMGRSKTFSITMIKKRLGHYRIGELTPRVFTDFATSRSNEGAGPATLTMDLSYLGTVLRHAGTLADAVPACQAALASLQAAKAALRHAGRAGASNQRNRRVTPAELDQLLELMLTKKRLNMPMMDLILFAIATCMRMRMGEICRIRWDDLDREKRTIKIRDRKDPKHKIGNDEVVPLLTHTTMWGLPLDPMRIIVRQIRRLREPRIFPYNPHSVSTMFTRYTAEAGIPDLNFHDLRHEGISRMFESGYQIEQVALVSGHKDWNTLRRYTQIDPTTLHRGLTGTTKSVCVAPIPPRYGTNPLGPVPATKEQNMSVDLNSIQRGADLRNEMGLMTEDELAALTGLKVETLIMWRGEGKGPDYTKLGRTVFYRRQDVQDWISANVVLVKRTGTKG